MFCFVPYCDSLVLTAFYRQKFGRSTRIDDCATLDATSTGEFALDIAPGAPRFNRFAFDEYAVPEAAPTPPAPKPNRFTFVLKSYGRVTPRTTSTSSSSPTSRLLSCITSASEVSEDKCRDEGKGAETLIGLGLSLINEEQVCFDLLLADTLWF